MGMTVYHHFVTEIEHLVKEARTYPLGGFPNLPRRDIAPDAPKVLVFSPHPDDECIIGGLALRLLREAGMAVVNVAVTQGSKRERQAERLAELRQACAFLGFELLQTSPTGLEQINPRTRAEDRATWDASVAIIRAILETQRPTVLFAPHDTDWNSTHVGTHHLVMDALARMPAEFSCWVVETEFWGAMATPNLMVESSTVEVGDLVTATTFHVGEVRRNPYHLLLPAWMQDNVRRGGELVGGQGAAAPDYTFATLYRLRRWEQGKLVRLYEGGRSLSSAQPAGTLLGF
jgi:LmbE family N-acetylglucosaminyl deacetylase